MKIHDTLLKGGTSTQTSTNLETGASGNTVIQNTTVYRDRVVNFSSSKGDYVSTTPHSYTCVRENYMRREYYYQRSVYPRYRITVHGHDGLAPLPLPSGLPDQSEMYNRAVDKFWQRVRGELDLSVSLGEWRASKAMFASLKPQNIIKRFAPLFEMVRAARRGELRDYRYLLTMPSQAYLEWLYGWRPFASDIFQAADQLIGLYDEKAKRVLHVKAYRRPPGSIIENYSGYVVEHKLKGVVGTRIKATVERMDLVQSAGTWSSLNPVSLTWELLPLSFVADWFFNVGDWLRRFENQLVYGSLIKDPCVSSLFTISDQQRWRRNTVTAAESLHDTYTGSRKEVRFQRTSTLFLGSVPPRPKLNVTGPLGSTYRMLSAASLIVTRGLSKAV